MSWKELSELVQQSAVAPDGWSKALQPTLTKIAEAIREYQPKLEEWSVQAAKVLEQLPERQRAIFGTLAEDGWYPNPKMGLAELLEAVKLHNGGNSHQARFYANISCLHQKRFLLGCQISFPSGRKC